MVTSTLKAAGADMNDILNSHATVKRHSESEQKSAAHIQEKYRETWKGWEKVIH